MTCSSCQRPCDVSDNYCRHCGTGLVLDVAVVRRSEPLPVPWEQMKPAVTRGVTALAAGLALELLLRRIRRGTSRPSRAVATGHTNGTPRPVDAGRGVVVSDAGEIVEAFRETVYVRRVRRAR